MAIVLLQEAEELKNKLNACMSSTTWSVAEFGVTTKLPILECKVRNPEEAYEILNEVDQLFPQSDLHIDHDVLSNILRIYNPVLAEMNEDSFKWPEDNRLGFSGDDRLHTVIRETMNSPELHLNVSDRGVCLAYANIGRNALLSRTTEDFSKRLLLFDEYPWPLCDVLSVEPKNEKDEFTDHISDLVFTENIMLVRFRDQLFYVNKDQEVAKEIDVTDEFLNEFDDNIRPLKRTRRLRKDEILMIKKFKDNRVDASVFLPGLIVSRQIPKDDRVSLLGFFDAIKLYQDMKKFEHLFSNEEMSNEAVTQLLMPEELEKTPIFKSDISFTSALKLNDMILYIQSMSQAMQQSTLTTPVTFMIENINHMMCLGYDINNAPNVWSLILVTNNKVLNFSSSHADIKKLAASVMRGFFLEDKNNCVGDNMTAIIQTEVYGHESEREKLTQCIQDWMSYPMFGLLHEIDAEKAKYVDGFYGVNWLELAVKSNETHVAIALIEKGADVNAVDDYDRNTSLHYAVYNNNAIVAAKLLENPSLKTNRVNAKGYTPLMLSVRYHQLALTDMFLKKNIDPNIKNKKGDTALHLAIKQHDIKAVSLLLENGANYFIENKEGKTPMDIAIETGFKEAEAEMASKKSEVSDLVKAIESSDIREVRGYLNPNFIHARVLHDISIHHEEDTYSLLDLAAEVGNVEIIKLLLNYSRKNLNDNNNSAPTAFYVAAKHGHDNVCEYLIECGYEVNKKDKKGYTQLDLAVKNNDSAVVETLLRFSANSASEKSALLGDVKKRVLQFLTNHSFSNASEAFNEVMNSQFVSDQFCMRNAALILGDCLDKIAQSKQHNNMLDSHASILASSTDSQSLRHTSPVLSELRLLSQAVNHYPENIKLFPKINHLHELLIAEQKRQAIEKMNHLIITHKAKLAETADIQSTIAKSSHTVSLKTLMETKEVKNDNLVYCIENVVMEVPDPKKMLDKYGSAEGEEDKENVEPHK